MKSKRSMIGRALAVIAAIWCLFAAPLAGTSEAALYSDQADKDPMLSIREGWAWPIVVIPPQGGWDTPKGESIKYAMRISEREISRMRGAIRGKEVVFLYSSLTDPAELPARLKQWRGMNVLTIICFAGGEMDQALLSACRSNGPSVIFVEGEELALLDGVKGEPYRYVFALDLPYMARANALSEAVITSDKEAHAAVISDLMSSKLAHGASLNVAFLRDRGAEAVNISIPAFRQDRFVPQIRDLESGGVKSFSVWLDAMAALSIWRTVNINGSGSSVYYCGTQHPILLDADGLMIVDKDSPLVRNEVGIAEMDLLMMDEFSFKPKFPVDAAKAYALSKWAIYAYRRATTVDLASINKELAHAADIPLMDDTISIDPTTHRPVMRKFGLLRVGGRSYMSHGLVEVFSNEAREYTE